MPNLVIASNNKAMPKLDGSLKHKVHDFFEKLNADHTSSSLHIEPIVNSKDSRVRTARVDQQFRAILFESPRRVRRLHVDRNYATPSILKPL